MCTCVGFTCGARRLASKTSARSSSAWINFYKSLRNWRRSTFRNQVKICFIWWSRQVTNTATSGWRNGFTRRCVATRFPLITKFSSGTSCIRGSRWSKIRRNQEPDSVEAVWWQATHRCTKLCKSAKPVKTRTCSATKSTWSAKRKNKFWIPTQSFTSRSPTITGLRSARLRMKRRSTSRWKKSSWSCRRNASNARGNFWRPSYVKPLKTRWRRTLGMTLRSKPSALFAG